MEAKYTEEVYPKAPDDARTADCEQISTLLDLMIDGEASLEEQKFFNHHIEECISCFENHQKQKLLKGLVTGHLKRVIVPQSLVHSIKAKIQETL